MVGGTSYLTASAILTPEFGPYILHPSEAGRDLLEEKSCVHLGQLRIHKFFSGCLLVMAVDS